MWGFSRFRVQGLGFSVQGLGLGEGWSANGVPIIRIKTYWALYGGALYLWKIASNARLVTNSRTSTHV